MTNKRKSIIYLCPNTNTPLGGVKVIFRHAELIKSMDTGKVDAFIYFPENPRFNVTWFEHSASIKRDNKFHCKSDFIIIPELWAIKFAGPLSKAGLKFAIFVQNGYLLFSGCADEDYIRLQAAYESASMILSISEDTTKCIKLAFPSINHSKIHGLKLSIDSNIFFPGAKENLITYMPRRLPEHSRNVVSFLRSQNLRDWKILPINNISEIKVAEMLRRSKIFLSFSSLEGLGVPPLEAAFCGNIVIGYTGEAGEEYFLNGIFTEIESGNIRKFVENVVDKVDELSKPDSQPDKDQNYHSDLQTIKERYSIESEKRELERLINLVDNELEFCAGADNFVSFRTNILRMAYFLSFLARASKRLARRRPAIFPFIERIYRVGNDMCGRVIH